MFYTCDTKQTPRLIIVLTTALHNVCLKLHQMFIFGVNTRPKPKHPTP